MVVVKAAELGCFAATSVDPIPVRIPSVPTRVVDSSGAGDAFNGGFLASWLAGEELLASIETSQALARQTLLHEGAIRS
jgi:2-dehydro-3-deoxygluconokinase